MERINWMELFASVGTESEPVQQREGVGNADGGELEGEGVAEWLGQDWCRTKDGMLRTRAAEDAKVENAWVE